jgi:hypothetical protein
MGVKEKAAIELCLRVFAFTVACRAMRSAMGGVGLLIGYIS